jgi:adenylate kinase
VLQLCDELESMLAGAGAGGLLVDFHSSSSFPVRWFELVLVLRCSVPVLHARLQSRGYSEDKLQENLEAEIMQVCLDEVREDWKQEQIMEMQSDTVEQQEEACARCLRWLQHRAASG